ELLHPSTFVVSALDRQPIPGIVVQMSNASGSQFSTTRADGFAIFDALTVTDDPQNGDPSFDPDLLPPQEVAVIQIDVPNHVPVYATRPLSANDKRTFVHLMPTERTISTGVIDASVGGRFLLPGLGLILVPPGALTQHASIHAIPLSSTSYSETPTGYELLDQFWIGTKSPGGQWIDALPVAHSGIILQRTVTSNPIPGPIYSETWQSSLSGADGAATVSSDVASRIGDTVVMNIGPGLNSVTRFWDAGELSTGSARTTGGGSTAEESDSDVVEEETGELLPTGKRSTNYVEVRLLSSRITSISTTRMLCGEQVDQTSASITASETKTTEHTLESSVTTEFGEEINTTIVKVGAKIGTEIKAGSTEGTSVTTGLSGSVTTPAGHELPGGDCFDADVVSGLVINKYRVDLGTKTVCVDSNGQDSVRREKKKVGEMEVPVGVATWRNNMAFNPNCAGCSNLDPQPEPPDVPGVNTD
ncbi:MAG: hypothetical protein AAFR54_15560, partial [Planctomycetota bacterium]